MRKIKLNKGNILIKISILGGFIIIFLFALNPSCEASESANVLSSKYNKYDGIIINFARKYDVQTKLIHSIISVESDYNYRALSSKGAAGLMQLMPETAKEYGVKDIYDPRENIEGGVKYLKDLIKTYNGKTDLVLAAYNAGQEAIKKHKGIPPYPETINFIRKVKRLYNSSTVGNSTKIYKFYDSSGTMVITNNARLKAINIK